MVTCAHLARCADEKKFLLTLPEPVSIKEFSVALLQPVLPQGMGVGVYYALAPFDEWVYMGMLSLDVRGASAHHQLQLHARTATTRTRARFVS